MVEFWTFDGFSQHPDVLGAPAGALVVRVAEGRRATVARGGRVMWEGAVCWLPWVFEGWRARGSMAVDVELPPGVVFARSRGMVFDGREAAIGQPIVVLLRSSDVVLYRAAPWGLHEQRRVPFSDFEWLDMLEVR